MEILAEVKSLVNKIKNKVTGKPENDSSEQDNIVEVPTILQMEATECGAASLAMVLACYGKWLPLARLREECGVSRDGSKAGRIIAAAKNLGCEASGYRVRAERLFAKGFPLILFWEFSHFVVLEGVKDGVFYLNDPACGRRQVPLESFKESYTGLCLKIRPGENFQKEGKPYSVVEALKKKLMNDKPAVIFMTIISLALIIPGLAVPVINRLFLDEVITLKHPGWMSKIVIALLLAVLLNVIMTGLRVLILTNWQAKLTLADSAKFMWHTLRLPLRFYLQRSPTEVGSRVMTNETVAGVLSDQAATAVLDVFIAVFYLSMLLQYSFVLTLIGVFFSALNVMVFLILRRRLTDMNMTMVKDTGMCYGVLFNGFSIIESIKANGTESDLFAKWCGNYNKVLVNSQKIKMTSMALTILPLLFGAVNSAVIMTVGGFSIMSGTLTTGMFMAFQSLMGSFQEPVGKLVGLGTTLQSTETLMKRLDDVMNNPTDKLNYPDEEQQAKMTFDKKSLAGELELKNISFGYNPIDPPLITDFNLHLKPGRWVAVVGFSGSGKSTMAKLVTGLFEEWGGEVLLDGVNRRLIPRSVITTSMAAIDQDIFQITGSIAENIAMFDKGIPHIDIVQACKDACIHDDIMRLDGGYEAAVAEGGRNFSGGQRQRMEIARALAVNPSILVMDEATSALDTVTEQKVMENIRRRGCSCFIVAHRLSTIRDCDEIIVMDRGKIAERGTHRELLAKNGAYCRLLNIDTAPEGESGGGAA